MNSAISGGPIRIGIVTNFGNRDGLDSAGVGNVRTKAQVDERSASIDRGRRSILDFVVDVVLLVLVVLDNQQMSYPSLAHALTLNISRRTSFGSSSRSNGCFSLTAILHTSSIPFQSSKPIDRFSASDMS